MSKFVTETHLRSFCKAFSWRVFATTTTVVISYIITGNVGDALTIGAFEFVTKIIIYYGHERIWHAIPWGLKTTERLPQSGEVTILDN